MKDRLTKIRLRERLSTRNGRIGVNIIASLGLKAMAIVVSFLLVPATLDYLNTFEYSIWLTLSSIMVWISYFDIGMGNGLRNKLTEALTKEDLPLARSYIGSTFLLMSAVIIGIYLLYTALHTWIDWPTLLNLPQERLSTDLNALVLVMLIPFSINFVMRCLGSIYQAKQMPFVNDLLIGLGSLLSLLSIYILQWFKPEGRLEDVALCFSFAPMLVYLVALPITFARFKELRPSWQDISLKHSKEVLSLGGQFFVMQMASLLLFATANFFLSRYSHSEEVVHYNIAYRYFSVLPMAFVIIITPYWSAATEAFTKHEFEWIRQSVRRMLLLWLVFGIGGTLMLLLSGLAYRLWVGLSISLSLSIALLIYMMVSCWVHLFSFFINGIGRTRVQLYSSVMTCIIYIPLAIYCTKAWGGVGICVAMSTSLLFSAILLPIQYRYLMQGSKHWFWSK